MKAIVCPKYGSPDVLQYKEVEKPSPGDDEILVKVHAASLNMYDWHLLTADIFLVRLAAGMLKPNTPIPGADIAGRVEGIGSRITRFKPGDEVYGDIGSGGFAEYACTGEARLALKPAGISFEESAAMPMAALTALQGMRDAGKIRAGQKVVINGASGGVGTFAIQIAKSFGAEVTAVCSTGNLDTARSLGADHVVDYTREDFTRNGQQYDLIFAVNGYHPIFDYRRALSPQGNFVMVGGAPGQMLQAITLGPLLSSSGGKKMGMISAKVIQEDLVTIKELGRSRQAQSRDRPALSSQRDRGGPTLPWTGACQG